MEAGGFLDSLRSLKSLEQSALGSTLTFFAEPNPEDPEIPRLVEELTRYAGPEHAFKFTPAQVDPFSGKRGKYRAECECGRLQGSIDFRTAQHEEAAWREWLDHVRVEAERQQASA